jgi:DNA-binding transcriptional ArsR family regulator
MLDRLWRVQWISRGTRMLCGPLPGKVLDDLLIPVATAELMRSVGSHDRDRAVLDRDHRDVERAAAEVVDEHDLIGDVLHAIRDRRGGRLTDLHAEVSVHDDVVQIDKPRWRNHTTRHDLAGDGMLLVPSIFLWPRVVFTADTSGTQALNYPARGIGSLWDNPAISSSDDDPLGALLGRSRAAILRCLALPHSTTELALKLGQSAPSVSQHLSVLRRNGLVVSWRSGRSVLYRATPLAASVVDAASDAGRAAESRHDTPSA